VVRFRYRRQDAQADSMVENKKADGNCPVSIGLSAFIRRRQT
jgi:hypothetical protein